MTLLEGIVTEDPVVRLDFLQLKTGKQYATDGFLKGTLATERALPTVRVSTDAFAGILVKAERGLATLLPALHACFPRVTWALGGCWILSTPPMTHAADGFAAENPSEHAAFHIRDSPEGDTIRAGTKGMVAGPLEFPWVVHDGLGWVRGILPTELSALL